MSIPDKIAAAKKIDELLREVVTNGALRLKYRITVDPPLSEERDWERPEILVQLSGPDSPLLLERSSSPPRSSCWRSKCSACKATSTRRFASTA